MDEDGANANLEALRGPVDIEKELEHFRLQWHRELVEDGPDDVLMPQDQTEKVGGKQDCKPTTEEEV